MQVAYIVPSSPVLIGRVLSKFDFSRPRVIVEFGPGEGCHTRELARRMHPESRLLSFELDPEFTRHLRREFADDPRVEIIHDDAAQLRTHLEKRGHPHCDYVVSGIPFSTMDPEKKRALLHEVHAVLSPEPHSAFIIYQVTNELLGHTGHFAGSVSEYCLANVPPMFVTVYYKNPEGLASANGKGRRHAAKKARV